MKTPKTYLVGITAPDIDGLSDYLEDTGQDQFFKEFLVAKEEHGPIALCSFYAKLYYKSLVEGKNANVTKTRDIESNVKATFDMGHGSVFEHVNLNFITTNCSRVFTHELVRHRVGTAFSQTNGRYCTVEDAELVLPPVLFDLNESDDGDGAIADGMNDLLEEIKEKVAQWRRVNKVDEMKMADKKKITSALRRIMPNGAVNEIGWSANIRSLRHMIEMRTSRHAEWEIRHVFNEVARLVKDVCPLMLYGAEVEEVDGLKEYTNLKV